MGGAEERHGIGWMATLLGLAMAAGVVLPLASASPKPAKPKPAPVAAQAPLMTTLPLDTRAYYEAHKSLDSGNLDDALQRFCDAMAPVRSVGYTLNLALLSDPSSVGSAVRGLRSNRKEPIFVVRKLYRGTPCYGLLLGLFPSKGEANKLAASLPTSLRKARPYPSALTVVCDLCLPEEPPVMVMEKKGGSDEIPQTPLRPPTPPDIISASEALPVKAEPSGTGESEPLPYVTTPVPVQPPREIAPALEPPAEASQERREVPGAGFPFQPQPAPVVPATAKATIGPPELAQISSQTAELGEEGGQLGHPTLLEPSDKRDAEANRPTVEPPSQTESLTPVPAPRLEVMLPPTIAAPAAIKDLRDRPSYKEAHRLLAAGSLAPAVERFCQSLAQEPATAWSLSIVLVCAPEAVAAQVALLREVVQEPVFVLQKSYKDTLCYRICVGVLPGRHQATLIKSLIPLEWAKAGPFPFPLRGVCEPFVNPATPQVLVLAPANTSPEKAAETIGSGDRDETLKSLPPAPSVSEPPIAAQIPAAPMKTDLAPPETAPPVPEPSAVVVASTQPLKMALALPEALPQLPPKKGTENAPGPAEGEVWFQKGLSAHAKGQTEEAIEAYEQALKNQPEKPEVLNNLGVLYLQQREFAAARDLLFRAVSAAPGYGRARLNLAGALWGLGERDAAMEQARTASILNSGDASAHLMLASFLAAVGRKEEALAEASVVLALEPGNRQAEHLIADITK